MKTVRIALALFFICISFSAIGQTEEERQEIISNYDIEKLKELEIQFRRQQESEKTQALRYAAQFGWEIEKELPNGGRKVLVSFNTHEGRITPIYNSTENGDARKATRVKHLNTNAGLGLDLQGENMTVHVWDEGITKETHNIFDGNGGNNRASTGDATSWVSDHATHVTGTIIGKNIRKGMAPKAKSVNYDWDWDLAEATAAAASGALLSNHSYGWAFDDVLDYHYGYYSGAARLWDMIMYNAPYYLMVKAAGNIGDLSAANGSPINGNTSFDKLYGRATAKNNLVIANIEDIDTNSDGTLNGTITRYSTSSQGPTDDFRIKPDISANGDGVRSSSTGFGNSNYSVKTGTSMAAPNASGTLLLLQEHYNNIKGNFMRAATLKGLALHTADDAGITGPDAEFGWGLLNAVAAAEVISNEGVTTIIRELNLENDEVYEMHVTASCGDELDNLKVSISWTDPDTLVHSPSINNPASVLVNDLDVRVSRGIDYTPWRLTGVDTNGVGDNRVDPYERIDIDNAQEGVYTIRVTHKGTLTNEGQRFSLIVSGISQEVNEGIAMINYDSINDVQGDGIDLHTYPNLVGDVDGDGTDDIVFVGQNWDGPGLNIRTKLSNGDGTWTSTFDVQGDGIGVHTYPTLIGDVNGDDKADLVFVGQNWSGAGLNIRTKLSNGDGTWTSTSEVQGDGISVHTYPPMIGFVDDDNKADLIFVGQNWSGAGLNIRTKLSNGDGTWTSTSDIQGDGIGMHTYPSMIGDVNGDGRDDIVFVGQNWSGVGLNIRTKLSNGDGSWTSTSDIQGDGIAVHAHPSKMGDVNGDGKDDIVFVGQNWSGAGLNIRTKFSNGDGSWTHASDIQGDGLSVHLRPMLTGDFNGDCKMDLLFTGHNWACSNGLHIRTKLSVGNGTWFHNSELHQDGQGLVVNPTLVGDTNNDGKTDVLFVGQNWQGVGLNIRTKKPLFSSEGCYDCSEGPVANVSFVNTNSSNIMHSLHGNVNVAEVCLVDPILVDGSASQCEAGYYIEVIEFDLANWVTVGTPLYSDWVCTGCTAPNNINLLDFVSLSDLDPDKVYKLKLAVGSPWNETNKFFTVINCSRNPHDTAFTFLEDLEEAKDLLETLNIDDISMIDSENIRIYPNPTNGEIFIDAGEKGELYTVRVYNLSGKEIIKKKLEIQVSDNKMDLSNLSSGVYLVIVSDKNDQPIKVSKVIKE